MEMEMEEGSVCESWSNFSLQKSSRDGVIGASGAPHPGGKHESSLWPTIENERRWRSVSWEIKGKGSIFRFDEDVPYFVRGEKSISGSSSLVASQLQRIFQDLALSNLKAHVIVATQVEMENNGRTIE